MATSYRVRPCELAGLDLSNQWVAWQFDRAVTFYGRWVENEHSMTDKKGTPLRSITDILDDVPPPQPPIEALIGMFGVEVVDVK